MAQNPADPRRPLTDGSEPPGSGRSIFRAQALQHYAQNQDRAVFPRLVSPRCFGILWVFAGIFLVAGLLIAFWPFIGPLLTGGP